MAEYEDGRKYDSGDIVGDLECVAVSYQENEENGRYNFTYQFKPHKEMEAQRKADEDLAKAVAEAKEREEAEAAEAAKREAEEEKAHRNEA